MERVLITGGSGLVGRALTKKLIEKGYEVSHLSRTADKSGTVKSFRWNVKAGTIDEDAIINADHIIHLAGAGIADKRWSDERKKEIIESRVSGIRLLYHVIQKKKLAPKTFITASAVGYYGAKTSDHIFTEEDPPDTDFLGECCRMWETTAMLIKSLDIRTAILRTALVLSNDGGALPRLLQPVKYFVGAPFGSGLQYMPWIHIDDLCAIYIKVMEDNSMEDVYNAVAPEHINNRSFVKALAAVSHRPGIIPAVPAFVLKLLLGEMAVSILEGSRVSCDKLLHSGFEFQHPYLKEALENLLA